MFMYINIYTILHNIYMLYDIYIIIYIFHIIYIICFENFKYY